MKSLTDVAGFGRSSTAKRLGEIAESRTIKEAVVAVPYVINSVENVSKTGKFASSRKNFISIPQQRYEAALASEKGSLKGDSLDAAGESIRKLTQKMERYILPPQFDFLNNPTVNPVVMYIFEFEFELDQDDLSYIWQNLAPRDYKKISFQHQSVAHELIDTELLSEANVLDNENLRWMIFKVKQKAQTNYYDLVTPQAGEASKDVFSFDDETSGYKLGFNWPYDYLSFVELIKIDTEVLFKQSPTSTDETAELSTGNGTAKTSNNKKSTKTSNNKKSTKTSNNKKSTKSKSMKKSSSPKTKGRY